MQDEYGLESPIKQWKKKMILMYEGTMSAVSKVNHILGLTGRSFTHLIFIEAVIHLEKMH